MIRAHVGVAKNLSSVAVSKAERLLSPNTLCIHPDRFR